MYSLETEQAVVLERTAGARDPDDQLREAPIMLTLREQIATHASSGRCLPDRPRDLASTSHCAVSRGSRHVGWRLGIVTIDTRVTLSSGWSAIPRPRSRRRHRDAPRAEAASRANGDRTNANWSSVTRRSSVRRALVRRIRRPALPK